VQPTIRVLSIADLRDCLLKGWSDFVAYPTHAILLAVFYPIAGLILAVALNGYALLPYLLPLASGFAILGPFAAVPLYDISRQREHGKNPELIRSFDVLRSPTVLPLLGLGLLLALIFTVWLLTARALYISSFGYAPLFGMMDFLQSLRSQPGSRLLLQGAIAGGAYALLAFVISVVSFPALMDRGIGIADAILISLRVVLANPIVMLAWGAMIAALLIIASLPLFIGLSVVLPVLAHASWHIYREAVV